LKGAVGKKIKSDDRTGTGAQARQKGGMNVSSGRKQGKVTTARAERYTRPGAEKNPANRTCDVRTFGHWLREKKKKKKKNRSPKGARPRGKNSPDQIREDAQLQSALSSRTFRLWGGGTNETGETWKEGNVPPQTDKRVCLNRTPPEETDRSTQRSGRRFKPSRGKTVPWTKRLWGNQHNREVGGLPV